MFEPEIVCPLCRGSGRWSNRNVSELSHSRVSSGECGRCGGRGTIIDPAYLAQQDADREKAERDRQQRTNELERKAFKLADRFFFATREYDRQAALNSLLCDQDLARVESPARNQLASIARRDQEACLSIVAELMQRKPSPHDYPKWKSEMLERIGENAQIALVDLMDAEKVSVSEACDHLPTVGDKAAGKLCSLLRVGRSHRRFGPLFPLRPRPEQAEPAEFSLQEKTEIVRAIGRQVAAVEETFWSLGRTFEEEAAKFGGWLRRRLQGDRDRVELCSAVIETFCEFGPNHEWTERILARAFSCPGPIRKLARRVVDVRQAMEHLSAVLTNHAWEVTVNRDDGSDPWVWLCEFYHDGTMKNRLQSPHFPRSPTCTLVMDGNYELAGRFLRLTLISETTIRIEKVTPEVISGSCGVTMVPSEQTLGSGKSVPSIRAPVAVPKLELTGDDLAKLPTRAVIRLVVEVHEQLREMHPERFFVETRDQRRRVREILEGMKQFSLGKPLPVLERQYQQLKVLRVGYPKTLDDLSRAILLGYMTNSTNSNSYRKKLDETVKFLNGLSGEFMEMYDIFLETANDPAWETGRDIEITPPFREPPNRSPKDICRDLPRWAEVAFCVKLAMLIKDFVVRENIVSSQEEQRLTDALKAAELNLCHANWTVATDQQLSSARSFIKGAKESVKRRTAVVDDAFEGMWLAIRVLQCAIADDGPFHENAADLYDKADVVLGSNVIRRCLDELELALRTQDVCADSEVMLSKAFPSGATLES